MAKYTDHHSRVKRGSFIEEAPPVQPTADSATSQVRARQLALQRQGSPKQHFVSSRALRMDKTNRPASISVPNTYAQSMASPQAEECKPSATSAGRSTTSARRTPFKLQHLEVATTAPARKTALDHRDGLANFLRQPPSSQKSLLHGGPYKIAAFNKCEKIKPVFNSAVYGVRPDSTVCCRTFQSPTNRDVPRNQIGNVPTNYWPIIIQLQDCHGPGKNKADVRHMASQPFSPFLSKRLFSPSSPSIQESSINGYPNGTPVNNRRQALEMWVRLKLISREYCLVQQFVLCQVATARQLRISKG